MPLSYTEALAHLERAQSLGLWVQAAVGVVQVGAGAALWLWCRDQYRALAAAQAAALAEIMRTLQHPSLDARAMSQAVESIDGAVAEARGVCAQAQDALAVARLIAERGGVDTVAAEGGV